MSKIKSEQVASLPCVKDPKIISSCHCPEDINSSRSCWRKYNLIHKKRIDVADATLYYEQGGDMTLLPLVDDDVFRLYDYKRNVEIFSRDQIYLDREYRYYRAATTFHDNFRLYRFGEKWILVHNFYQHKHGSKRHPHNRKQSSSSSILGYKKVRVDPDPNRVPRHHRPYATIEEIYPSPKLLQKVDFHLELPKTFQHNHNVIFFSKNKDHVLVTDDRFRRIYRHKYFFDLVHACHPHFLVIRSHPEKKKVQLKHGLKSKLRHAYESIAMHPTLCTCCRNGRHNTTQMPHYAYDAIQNEMSSDDDESEEGDGDDIIHRSPESSTFMSHVSRIDPTDPKVLTIYDPAKRRRYFMRNVRFQTWCFQPPNFSSTDSLTNCVVGINNNDSDSDILESNVKRNVVPLLVVLDLDDSHLKYFNLHRQKIKAPSALKHNDNDNNDDNNNDDDDDDEKNNNTGKDEDDGEEIKSPFWYVHPEDSYAFLKDYAPKNYDDSLESSEEEE